MWICLSKVGDGWLGSTSLYSGRGVWRNQKGTHVSKVCSAHAQFAVFHAANRQKLSLSYCAVVAETSLIDFKKASYTVPVRGSGAERRDNSFDKRRGNSLPQIALPRFHHSPRVQYACTATALQPLYALLDYNDVNVRAKSYPPSTHTPIQLSSVPTGVPTNGGLLAVAGRAETPPTVATE